MLIINAVFVVKSEDLTGIACVQPAELAFPTVMEILKSY